MTPIIQNGGNSSSVLKGGRGRIPPFLSSPSNPDANLTDTRGITFVDGRAEGVRRSVAAEYVRSLDGYEIEEGA